MIAALVAALFICGAGRATSGETEAGRAVYMGQATAGIARVGSEAGVAAGRFGCFSCHGGDGLGGGEGGVLAPAITRERLDRATGKRPAYDFNRFARAVGTGLDPAGRRLNPVMARYELDEGAVAALYEFLASVEDADRAGVGDASIAFGVIHDPDEAEAGEIVRRSLQDALGRLGDPTVFGRSVTIRSFSSDDPAAAGSVLAALMPVAGAERTGEISSARHLPVLAPVRGVGGDENANLTRGIQASARDQWRALAADAPAGAPVVYPPTMSRDRAAALQRRFGLASGRQLRSLEDWRPEQPPAAMLLLGGLAGAAPPPGLAAGTTVLSTLDGSAAGIKPWRSAGASIVLADARPVNRETNRIPDIDRFAEATLRIVLEVLARSGRDLTRTRFMAAFDNASIVLPNWPSMDYGEFRLTGTDKVSLLRVPATAEKP